MYSLKSAIEGALGIRTTNSYQTLMSVRSGQEPVIFNTITALTTGAKTLTAAQLLGGIIEHNTAAATDTTDTGANLDAAIDILTVDQGQPTFTCQLINTGAATITLAGGSGVTVKGNTSVAAGKVSYLMFLRTGTGTWNCYTSVSA